LLGRGPGQRSGDHASGQRRKRRAPNCVCRHVLTPLRTRTGNRSVPCAGHRRDSH
jgi:hypothetical protein